MSEKIIRIKSGNEETTMNVTEEEYRNYFRPWWQMKKREHRNREAMEQNGYTEESYEEWKENDMWTELFAESMEELAEKRMLLGVLQDAMDSLLPEERELAMKVFGEEMSICEYAKDKGENRRTMAFRKDKVLEKLRHFFVFLDAADRMAIGKKSYYQAKVRGFRDSIKRKGKRYCRFWLKGVLG